MSYDGGSQRTRCPVPRSSSPGVTQCAIGEADEHGLRKGLAKAVLDRIGSEPRHRGFGPSLIEQSLPSELKRRRSLDHTAASLPHGPSLPLKEDHNYLDVMGLNNSLAEGSFGNIDQDVLRGCRVLVVEDDFLLADYTRLALREAGAQVLGPVAQEDQALALIDARKPNCALLDINLGEGARFAIADALRDLEVPFMFVTGYDDVMIPRRFNDIGRIRKPSGCRLVVRAAAQMYHSVP